MSGRINAWETICEKCGGIHHYAARKAKQFCPQCVGKLGGPRASARAAGRRAAKAEE